jgi:hypothetical protein
MKHVTDRKSASAFRKDRDEAIRHISDAVQGVNEAILRAVEAGVSIELVRTSRCHDGRGNWGDQMIPAIRRD